MQEVSKKVWSWAVHEFVQKAVTSFRANSFDTRMKDHGKKVEFGTHKNARWANWHFLLLPEFSMVPGFCLQGNLPQQAVENATIAVAEEAGIWAPGKPGRSLQKWILDAVYPGRAYAAAERRGVLLEGGWWGGCDVGCDVICCLKSFDSNLTRNCSVSWKSLFQRCNMCCNLLLFRRSSVESNKTILPILCYGAFASSLEYICKFRFNGKEQAPIKKQVLSDVLLVSTNGGNANSCWIFTLPSMIATHPDKFPHKRWWFNNLWYTPTQKCLILLGLSEWTFFQQSWKWKHWYLQDQFLFTNRSFSIKPSMYKMFFFVFPPKKLSSFLKKQHLENSQSVW